MPEAYRERALAGHALSHRMLRVFEAARARGGESAVDALYTEWGRRYFLGRWRRRAGGSGGGGGGDALLAGCLSGCGLSADLLGAADDEKWDAPIVEAMEVAYQLRRAQDPDADDRRAGARRRTASRDR